MQTGRLWWNTARRFMSNAARKNDHGGNSLNQQVLDEYMVPGQYLRYFKKTRQKKRSLESSPTATLDKVYKQSARSMHENDSAPTTTQQHFAQRIHRGINNMYSYESLPRWLTPSNVGIQAVKVGRNLRKCQIFYEAKGSSKEERGHATYDHQVCC
ncbi:hypothetical protein O0I10_009701 [Lichtheimia ornata]|uniref:Uncharacterized protein n=1 Tax=Lichtheimia ornata TaxID=688661 RepID=A0AAD7XU81_9FUNG|nr:uncharacterized protein O0I10_009701 [Lichtheimia ornata]KAJ8654650.1 hypothetical protein O0I10_009701 [Lichtheimia ornata]